MQFLIFTCSAWGAVFLRSEMCIYNIYAINYTHIYTHLYTYAHIYIHNTHICSVYIYKTYMLYVFFWCVSIGKSVALEGDINIDKSGLSLGLNFKLKENFFHPFLYIIFFASITEIKFKNQK